MTVVDATRSAGLFARVGAIILRPNSEWEVIDREVATIPGLLIGYVCVLAAIRAVCLLIGGQLYGFGVISIHAQSRLEWSLRNAVAGYVLALASTIVLALLIDILALRFGATKNLTQAVKLAAYSGTAAWVAGVLWLVPRFGPIVALFGLYGLYLLYTGLPKLMKPAAEKARQYTIFAIFLAVVINLVAANLVGWIAGPAGDRATVATRRDPRFATVDGQTIDLRRLEAVARAVRASQAVDPEKLKALVPDQIDAIPRTNLIAQPASASAVSVSSVEAVYARGGTHVTLRVADLKAMGPYAGLAGVIDARRSAGGYQKVGKVNDRLTIESWDGAAKSGRYRVVVANRFMVEALGPAPSIDVLKSAVAAVAFDRLEAMAKS